MNKQNQRGIPITMKMVEASYQEVRKKGKAGGVDGQSLSDFESHLAGNLYKIWNRMSSGSYFPPAVREVRIPKEGGERRLGLSTKGDRVAQGVIKHYLEPRLEEHFHESSYGYRPSRSAHEALAAVKGHCRRNDWVIDLDIEGFFDNIAHDLLLRALERHVEERWVKMYVVRWLKMPIQQADGTLVVNEDKGVPQGGVISPLLANLYLHYVLDKWLERRHTTIKFVRYADDMIIHCQNRQEAEEVLAELSARLLACRLRLNASKTRLVNCKHPTSERHRISVSFDFLGYTFGPQRYYCNKRQQLVQGFGPSISGKSVQRILATVKTMRVLRDTRQDLETISRELSPKLRGWINYYGRYRRYKLGRMLHRIDSQLAKWLRKRYRRLKGSQRKAMSMLERIKSTRTSLFYHWSALSY